MSLWTSNEKNLMADTAGGNYVKQSGIYKCSIEEVQIIKGQEGASEALQVVFKTEDNASFRVRHWYKTKAGRENEINVRLCDQLFYLLKLKVDKVKVLDMPDGRTIIPDLFGKNIGVINEVSFDGQYYNHNVKAYFDISSGKTTKEILEKQNPETVNRWREIFDKVEPKNIEEKTEDKNEGLPEEFPF